MHRFRAFRVALPLFATLVVGCSGSDTSGRQETYEVSGTITMAGGPVPNAAVTFSPKEGQPVARGRTDEQGHYTLTTYEPGDGAAAGEYAVLVTKSAASSAPQAPTHGVDVITPPSAAMHSGPKAKGKVQAPETGLPERYADWAKTDLSATVKPDGENVFDFELRP